MNAVTLEARYDGTQICPDEPYPLQPGTLLVTVLAGVGADAERAEWLAASQAGLARAAGESEPDYSDAVLREEPPPQ